MPGHRAQDNFRVALAGIDGAGKSTAAADLRGRLQGGGTAVVVYGVFGGRKTLDKWARRFGTDAVHVLGARCLDLLETLVRTVAMLRMCLARQDPGTLVLMDRSFYCQLALRQSRGLRGGGPAGRLLGLFPKPDLVVYFAIRPEQALQRVRERGSDTESLEALQAFDAGYRALEDFGSFAVIDAGRSRAEVADQLERVIRRAGGQTGRRP